MVFQCDIFMLLSLSDDRFKELFLKGDVLLINFKLTELLCAKHSELSNSGNTGTFTDYISTMEFLRTIVFLCQFVCKSVHPHPREGRVNFRYSWLYFSFIPNRSRNKQGQLITVS